MKVTHCKAFDTQNKHKLYGICMVSWYVTLKEIDFTVRLKCVQIVYTVFPDGKGPSVKGRW